MTVGQGEGCADLVRRAPPGHRAAAAQARPVERLLHPWSRSPPLIRRIISVASSCPHIRCHHLDNATPRSAAVAVVPRCSLVSRRRGLEPKEGSKSCRDVRVSGYEAIRGPPAYAPK
jgi:hypothetical protein